MELVKRFNGQDGYLYVFVGQRWVLNSDGAFSYLVPTRYGLPVPLFEIPPPPSVPTNDLVDDGYVGRLHESPDEEEEDIDDEPAETVESDSEQAERLDTQVLPNTNDDTFVFQSGGNIPGVHPARR